MAYTLGNGNKTVEWGVSLIDGALSGYTRLDDPDFDWEMDELLRNRSALELVRDRLSEAQVAELEMVDIYWRAKREAFNACFSADHARRSRMSLAGFVEDENGDTPDIPRDHWWWRPIEKMPNNGQNETDEEAP
jgi:hypothetical protein